MANIVKDIGAVSAYALAVKHGFKGTEEEWAKKQADAGTNAQRAEAAANDAEAAARTATSQATNAATSAQKAQTAQTSAAGSVTEAASQAANAQASAQTAAQQATNAAESVIEATGAAKSAEASANAAAQSAEDAAASAEEAREVVQTAAQIDDSAASFDKVWSSKSIVDRLCPRFEVSGAQVSCYPVAGYPLSVVSQIEAVQAGSSVPSPDNVRPISGHDSVVLHHNDTVYEVSLGGLEYGGTYDWTTGLLTREAETLLLNGDETWFSTIEGQFYAAHDRGDLALTDEEILCSHFVVSKDGAYQRTVDDSIAIRATRVWIYSSRLKTVEDLKAYLAANVVMLVYRLAEPVVTAAGEGLEIMGLDGENVLSSSTGLTKVSGRADPLHMMAEMAARIEALEAAVINSI